MNVKILAALTLSTTLCALANAAVAADTQTIVLLRHGEKPAKGLGQLSCQGLNRALALPAVVAARFGRPDVVFAPDPSDQKKDGGEAYDYVRPLATIEPLAIAFGLPVNADFGLDKTKKLRKALDQPKYRRSLALVAWEHNLLPKIANKLLADHGGSATAPKWNGDDYDGMYVVRVTRDGDATTAAFERVAEGLDGLPAECPKAPTPAASSATAPSPAK